MPAFTTPRPGFVAAVCTLLLPLGLAAQTASPPADPRFKADILLVVAHPDDESVVTSYLSQAMFDEGKRVAVIFGTRGDGGGNTAGPEQASSLGAIREIEGRRALAILGIDNVWFLDGKDTPSQDVLQSLGRWHHGDALEQTVRLVRLTRPEVVITWLPAFVLGENHGDHQAAGVIATEAFDLAADPSAFPSQVAPSRNRTGTGNLTEGLAPWQPKKIYYFSDRANNDGFRGHGPSYASTAVSPSKKQPYYEFAAKSLASHLSQGSEGRIATEAVKSGNYKPYLDLVRSFSGTTDAVLILGKSLVGGSETGDVFEGVTSAHAPRRSPASRRDTIPPGVAIALGGPWHFYDEFRQAHEIDRLGALVPPELGVAPGSEIGLPIILRNGGEPASVTIRAAVPSGWTVVATPAATTLQTGDAVDLQLRLKAPSTMGPSRELAIEVRVGDRVVGVLRLGLTVTGTMPF